MKRLAFAGAGWRYSRGYSLDVERLVKTDRAYVIAAAAARTFNDELTVILSSLACSYHAMEPGHPARRPLVDLELAALRCAATTHKLMDYGGRRGARALRVGLDALLED
jgi:hypothetical protein